MNTSLYNNYRKEIRTLISGVLIISVFLIVKIFSIQILQHDKYKDILTEETVLVKEEEGHRGKIYDRNNLELASNINKVDFWVNTSEEFDKNHISAIFSKTFNKDVDYYLNILSNKNHYVVVEKNVEELYCKHIIDSINDIKGLRYNVSLKRFYPYDNLLANIIGFFDSGKNNSSGIENHFNDILSGEKLNVKHQILDNKRIYLNKTNIPSGKNIGLTIDLELQSILVNELEKGMKSSGAESANGIIVAPHTGDILAMASIPSFNANQYEKFNIADYKNRVISSSYEPGSTYKIVALTAALQDSKIDLMDSIYCENGVYKLKNGHLLHDHEPHGNMSVSDIFAFSSNIGMSKIAELISKQKLYNKSREFGFGVDTGILLPGEESGILRSVENWTYQSNKSLAIGQEISCTSLQLAMAYSSIANGGYLLQPRVIKYIGGVSLVNNPIVIRRVMDSKTSKKMLALLRKVVTGGSGMNASLKGYDIGGKTGTAQKFIDGEYSQTKYISSFASVFPVKNPKYVCVVSIDSPDKNRGKHWGGETAAPIIKEIYKKIINQKKIKPETFVVQANISNKTTKKAEKTINLNVIPNFKGKTLKDAIETGKYIGIKIKPKGYSGRVVWQSVKPGVKIDDIEICELKVE